MIAVERFDITGNLRVGMVSEFEKDVYRTMKLFDDHEFYDNFEQYRKTFFEKVMEDLSPALITIENNEIYFLHPVFLGLLSHLQRPNLLSKKSLLIDLIRLMNYNRHEARLSDEAENLLKAGIAKNKLLNCINLINDALNYSRILKR